MKGFCAGLVLAVLSVPVWGQDPAGAEFQVNTYTTGIQFPEGARAVASDGSGNFVVVWTSYSGGDYSVFGQRFNASGIPQGSEFPVNTYTTGAQGAPAVASDANGNFVVVWKSNGQDGSGFGVFGRRFNASGVALASEFRVNTYTTSNQGSPRVASDPNGNFVVVWWSPHDGSGYGAFGRRFNASGVAQGNEFQLNSYTTGNQYAHGVAVDASGSFVVVWMGQGQDGDGYGVFGQRFNASGVSQGSEFRVNTYTTGSQGDASVASDANGNFVVVWDSVYQSYSGAFGRRFNASGIPQGSEFQVGSYPTSSQRNISVASDRNGNFVMVWGSSDQDGSGDGVFGQRFDASGSPLGFEFQVNSYTPGEQDGPTVASSSDGDFVVVWRSYGQDGSAHGVFGQRYGDLIFKNGFDSGDLSRWSSSTTDGGNLSVGAAAAMGGTTSGLQALVNDTNSIFVQDDNPNAEKRYRVRFYFDPNGFDPGESQSHFRTRILIAQGSGFRLITVVLKRQLGAYSVEVRVRRNDGTRADTGFFPISDGPHFIEFDWQRATGPGAGDGSLQMWIDGGSVATLSGIDNDTVPIDQTRMGALSVKTGAAGTLYYDQFESRRQVFIGAE